MKAGISRSRSKGLVRHLIAVLCVALIEPGGGVLAAGCTRGAKSDSHPAAQANSPSATAASSQQIAPTDSQEAAAPAQESPKIQPDQLDSLVAPIALYPDPLLSQTLVASTYPLEIMQLQQWLSRNPNLKDKALVDAVSKQPWDPSIQAMAALPDVVKRLADDIQWTTDLGNAFLAQQGDVMDAVQRMRQKAQGTGALASNPQVKVETQVVESKQVIVVEQANPQVVYVPSYNPTVVYGPPVYPYPPVYYPPYPTGAVVAASAISFGVGVAMGAAWGGGWGWNAGWGHGDVNINRNNNFNRNTNISGGNRTNISGNRGGGNTWQHNPQHRGGAPYSNRATASKFGGNARGDSLSSRQAGARQQVSRQGGNLGSARGGTGAGAGARDRGGAGAGAGARDRGGAGAGAGARDRGGAGAGAGARDRGGAGAGAGARNRGGAGAGAGATSRSGGGDRVGNRSVGSSSGGGRGGFGGGSGGFSGGSARQSSSRGASSMGSRGGGRSGGGRSGGGGRRR